MKDEVKFWNLHYSLLSQSNQELDTLVTTAAVHVVAVVHQGCGEKHTD